MPSRTDHPSNYFSINNSCTSSISQPVQKHFRECATNNLSSCEADSNHQNWNNIFQSGNSQKPTSIANGANGASLDFRYDQFNKHASPSNQASIQRNSHYEGQQNQNFNNETSSLSSALFHESKRDLSNEQLLWSDNNEGSFDESQSFRSKATMPLATDDDCNWLSDYLCFVRSQCVEVFTATGPDVAYRMNNKKVLIGQVGIRCCFCAHLPHKKRAGRSSSFPSSISRIYQSLTMMLRDHFVNCSCMPAELKHKYLALKGKKSSPGAADSKRYWSVSAARLGLIDTEEGIRLRQHDRSHNQEFNDSIRDHVYQSSLSNHPQEFYDFKLNPTSDSCDYA